jgi:PAS domain S-box-containing protein
VDFSHSLWQKYTATVRITGAFSMGSQSASDDRSFPASASPPFDLPVSPSRRRSSATPQRRPFASARQFAPFITVFLAYFVAGKLGQATTNIRSSNLGPVWPAYGIALASFLIYGYRVWPAVVMSAFVVAVQGSVSAVAAAGQAVGATLATLSGTFLLRRIAGFDVSLSRLRDALWFIIIGAFGSALVSSVVGVSSLYATGVQAYAGLGSAWLVYWLGDSSGALLITPLVATLAYLRVESRARVLEFATLLVLLTTACVAIFGISPVHPIGLHVLTFAVLPFVMWGAISFGVPGAAVSVFLIAGIATVLTALGSGPFVGNTSFVNAVLLDVLFAVLSISGLALAAVIAERERAKNEREQLLREQTALEARLHLAAIVESSDDAIWSQDLDGTILSWNAAAQRMMGYDASEAIGRPVTEFIPPALLDEERTIVQEVKAGERIVHRETTRRTKAGSRVDVSLTVSPLRDATGALIGITKIARDTSEQRKAREALSAVNRKLIAAQEQERSRIARELHDDICQRLSMLAFDITAGAPRGDSHADQLQRKVSEIAKDVQALSHNLHSGKLELLGLAGACQRFCEEFADQHKVMVKLDTQDVPRQIPPDISLCVYRILQEALSNAAKHSGVREFEIRLWATFTAVHLTVTDHGAGFDVAAATASPGIGLVSMQERVKLVCGKLSIESASQRGTSIQVHVPFA